jgi:TatD DNase family protein
MTPLVDSHAHLGLSAARGIPLDAALAEFSAKPDSFLMDIGTESADLGPRLDAIRTAWKAIGGEGEYPGFLRVSAGLYPDAKNLSDVDAAMRRLEAEIVRLYPDLHARKKEGGQALPRLAAIGECGMDFHWMEAPEEAQRRLFDAQLELAERLGLAVVVHSREAHAATLSVLKARSGSVKAVIHCYGYGLEEAKDYLEAGAFISFSGNLSYKGSKGIREAAAYVPEDRLLCETDAPYLNPEPLRGKPSGPLDVARTFSLLAQLRSASEESLARRIARNAASLFG